MWNCDCKGFTDQVSITLNLMAFNEGTKIAISRYITAKTANHIGSEPPIDNNSHNFLTIVYG